MESVRAAIADSARRRPGRRRSNDPARRPASASAGARGRRPAAGLANDSRSSAGVITCTENVSSFLRRPRTFLPSAVVTVTVSKPTGMTSPGRRISRSSAVAEREAPMRDRIGPEPPAAPADHVTAPAIGAAAGPEQLLAARRIAALGRRPAGGAQRPQIGDEHPHLFLGQVGVGRHLGAGHAAEDGLGRSARRSRRGPSRRWSDRCRDTPWRRCRGTRRSGRGRCSGRLIAAASPANGLVVGRSWAAQPPAARRGRWRRQSGASNPANWTSDAINGVPRTRLLRFEDNIPPMDSCAPCRLSCASSSVAA